MARTNATEVEERLGDDFDTSRSLTGFISSASFIIDDVITCAAGYGVTYSAARLQEMEAWVAAHLYKVSDRRMLMEKDGKASGQYMPSQYSEGALALDKTGCLAGILKGTKTVKAFWMGKRRSEQIDYRDRE